MFELAFTVDVTTEEEGADPDCGDTDEENNEHYDPFPVGVPPLRVVLVQLT